MFRASSSSVSWEYLFRTLNTLESLFHIHIIMTVSNHCLLFLFTEQLFICLTLFFLCLLTDQSFICLSLSYPLFLYKAVVHLFNLLFSSSVYIQSSRSDVTVVAFLIFPTQTNNFNVESLRGHAVTKTLKDTIDDVQKKVGARMFEICLT